MRLVRTRNGVGPSRGSNTRLRGREICGAGTTDGMLHGHGGSGGGGHRGRRDRLTRAWSTAGAARVVAGLLLILVGLSAQGQAVPAQSTQTLPLVTSASNSVRQGFVRIINHSSQAGTVELHAIDDSGQRFGPISLSLDATETTHLNSTDLEDGNASKGLSEGVGSGEGDWRLKLSTTLDIEPLAYIRAEDGFVTSMHDLVAEGASMRYHVPLFNPGSNRSQVSRLRLVNPTDAETHVVIDGLDDRGERPGGEVRLTLPAGGARTLGAQELESGGSGLSDGLGDGTGKWHLFVSADRPIQVMSLLRSPTGHLTNLSTSTSERDFDPPGFAPADQAALDALVVGKRIVGDDPSSYVEFVSPGRFREIVGSEADTGRYTYENTGPNSGTATFYYDDGDRCTFHLAFDSASTGTLTYSCDDGSAGTSSWRLVDASVAGLAPADQAAFNRLMVGRQLDAGTFALEFVSSGRFVESARSYEVSGSYSYSSTGPNTGTLSLTYDRNVFGGSCTVQLTYASSATGTWRYACASGLQDQGNWHLPGMGLEFIDGESTTRTIPENTPAGINAGAPVSARGGEGLTYSIHGTDADSFDIVPDTGQIRTAAGVVYDYETKRRYFVEVRVEDDAGNRDAIDVTVNLVDLVPSCGSADALDLRTGSGDGRLTVRWTPLPDSDGQARVLGYETEIRRGNTGSWTDRRTFIGRSITGTTYAGLDNEIGYRIRVRPIDSEGECAWSTPVSGIPTADRAPSDDREYHDRFGPHPVGTSDQHVRLLAPGRCRHHADGLTLDADCTYEKTGPDAGRIFLEFDDPSRGSCEVTLAYSSLAAGSFVDECFDAGVNTNVPFDRSFRMPRSGMPTQPDVEVPRAPRTQEEFDVLAWGRDDFIPGLVLGRLRIPGAHLDYDLENRQAWTVVHDRETRTTTWHPGTYEYENTGPSTGVLTFRAKGGGELEFTLDFEPSGNVRATVVDLGGNAAEYWTGISHLDLTLGAQPILLPIPPSWPAAIAVEVDFVPADDSIFIGLRERFVPDFFSLTQGSTGLDFHTGDVVKVGPNRVLFSWEFTRRNPQLFEGLEEPERSRKLALNGSKWTVDLVFTSDDAVSFVLTVAKEGNLPLVLKGVLDLKGDEVNLAEFPEELLLPDDPPQASGEDVSGVEVAAAVSTERIGSDDVQVFLVSASSADYRPGDWLEPKDGSNQRMMIVGADQAAGAASPSSRHTAFARSDQPGVPGESSKSSLSTLALSGTSTGSKTSELSSEASVESYASGGLSLAEPVRVSSSGSGIVPLSVVCMQVEGDIPKRGARYFSQPKAAQGPVQTCQRNCVLNQSRNIQNCVWGCEETARARRAQYELRFDDAGSAVQLEHTLPLVMSASSPVQQGFVRIINHSDHRGTVEIHAIDDSGRRFGPISLDMAARTSAHFNSDDLESGNADKGLSGGVGDGHGDWRLELNTALDIEPLAYVRTTDGFVTSMHDVVPEGESSRYHVPFFNPGSNRSQVSRLRLINPTDTEAEVTIDGLDDHGEPPDEEVHLTLPAGGARTISAQELEFGGSGLSGGFGDGAGKWHLFISAGRPIQVMSLLRSPTGHLTNLSTSTTERSGRSGYAPADQAAFDALVVGKWLIADIPDYDPLVHGYLEFVSPGRFVDVQGSETYSGRYTYENTGPNSGRLELDYDDGDRCTLNLAFDSATTGTTAYSCNDGPTGSLRWRLEDIDETVPADDRGVLVALYNATGGASWMNNTNWLSSAPLGQWYGVTTDESGRVIELVLGENQLSGPIPAELGRLSNLESLVLYSNQLSGPIPSELGRLSDLEDLWLHSNQLSGPIPADLVRLSNLESLVLYSNRLSGPIPADLGRLHNLRWLFLYSNQLSGPIPSELGRLSNLEGLYLDSNQLSGPIPADLGRLHNLRWLFLYSNQLSGPIPSELGRLSNLEGLWLSRNQLSGPIPSELGRLSNLEGLWLSRNQLSGPIPAELVRLSNLEGLSLSNNQLSGPIPADLGRLSNLEELWLHSNRLSGPIPADLGRLSNLEELWLHSNRLSGPIPAELGELSKLERLYLSGNQLSGCIPSGLRDVPESDLSELGLEFCGGATGPDLVVRSPAVSDSRPSAGESFTLSATVRNQGNSRSAATTLRYFRSPDATISTGDTQVGTDSVNRLPASGQSDESVELAAPSSAGTYYYGACVEPVAGESNTGNNCSSAVAVTVGGGGGTTTFGVGDTLPGVPTSGFFIPAIVSGASVSSGGGTTTIDFNNGGYIQLQDGTRYTCRATGGCQAMDGVVTRGTIVS